MEVEEEGGVHDDSYGLDLNDSSGAGVMVKEEELISSLLHLMRLRDIHKVPYRMIHSFVLFI